MAGIFFYNADTPGYGAFGTFDGPDGWPVNPAYWSTTGDGTWTLQNNELNITTTGFSYITASYLFSGDFDVRVAFKDLSLTTESVCEVSLYTSNAAYGPANYRAFQSAGWHPFGDYVFRSNIAINNVWQTENKTARTNDYGWLRLRRTGTTIHTLRAPNAFNDEPEDGDWTIDNGHAGFVTSDMYVHLVTSELLSCKLDNLKITNGTLV
jgi:hypothetical protein